MLRIWIHILLYLTASMPAAWAAEDASREEFTVLGVIASSANQNGVALLKHKKSKKVAAYREGSIVGSGMKIVKVNRKNVEFVKDGNRLSMMVGDDSSDYRNAPGSSMNLDLAQGLTEDQGFEKEGDTLKVNRELKDELLNRNLDKILMQAAAVPHMKEGRLVGFQLVEIDKGSIYDVAGLKDGDVITHINDLPINDAARAIKALGSLKKASKASFSYLRADKPHDLVIQVN